MKLARHIGDFRLDRLLIVIMLLSALSLAGHIWLQDHPGHNPWSPLNLGDPPGWATQRKLIALRNAPGECRAVLKRSDIAFAALESTGSGECRRTDRVILPDAPLAPARPDTSCAVAAGFEYWLRHSVQPAARELLGSPVAHIKHFGAFSCRRLYGRAEGGWSEHATGNALDVAGFVLEDGRQVSVLRDWQGGGDEAEFLHQVRDSACNAFGTVLSPDYNAAHADHLHLDQANRAWTMCR